jgi:hypothetical protein
VGHGDFPTPIAPSSLLALAIRLLYNIVDLKSTGWGTRSISGGWGVRANRVVPCGVEDLHGLLDLYLIPSLGNLVGILFLNAEADLGPIKVQNKLTWTAAA